MKALILAAGIGSRLRPITNSKPKTLVTINGTPMLGHILNALVESNVTTITICVGYEADQIVQFVKLNYPMLFVTFVYNKDYEDTNNMYSLYLARHELDDDTLIMNADLVFDAKIIKGIVKVSESAVAVDKGRYIDEAMKITIKDTYVSGIAKTILEDVAYGSSIDIYKINKEDIHSLKRELIHIIEKKHEKNLWTEVVLDQLFKASKLKAKPYDIKNHRWYEIDNFQDLSNAELIFNNHLDDLQRRSIIFFDRDGTLTLGDTCIEGSVEVIEKLKKKEKKVFVLTNNSSLTSDEHYKAFKSKGLPVKRADVLSSLDASIDEIKQMGLKRLFWVANRSVSAELSAHFIHDPISPQGVLLTWDTSLTYAKILKTTRLLQSGIPYFATHSDMLCPTPKGPIPDIGTIIQLIEHATGRVPDNIFGKPSPNMIKPKLKELGVTDKDVVIVGDRLYTDIMLANNTNILSVLVLSGETSRAEYETSNTRADIVVPSVKYLIDFL